ncbi:phospho-N-acetylmuramoyl-pentapeptide-transferase [Leptospira sp. FAT2]|uniref:phospho-N-acetylmuramoyl-pentapeptide- transferase n=1 Tax=Leptospira sanjuanensis TaxID=2879643 RepID=UPI001EE9567A|nr:phospho-N-acetylmuramoyl-pentapeptide-transferase [Leptospira sanjuanensis]MCG6167040.1 phospho-N-acetylmuramoyl-pentapeptide-transferase [Leptospira sanjuanensis]MCG6192495.1 phospho-N-acetylmuramoyl-pentapeptide-transferase [Leptospira sanjuanensis]
MFYYLYDLYFNHLDSLRIFSYVTFRALMAGLTSMLVTFWLGHRVIDFLYGLKFRESVRDDGPKTHEAKKGTPTMGGLLIIGSLLLSVLLWGNLKNLNIVLLSVFSLCFSALGFADDYMKSVKKIKGGMRARTKFVLSILISLAFCILFFYYTGLTPEGHSGKIPFHLTDLFFPFVKGPVIALGILAIPFSIIVIIGSSHAVNLTDGLDGLATGTVAISVVTLGIIAYVSGTPVVANYLNIPYLPGAHEYSVFLSALAGALLGFLWFNAHPAQVFMGDTGSLFLGATLGMVVILLKKEILLLILGAIFVSEALSVILQVGSFKLRGKRIFKMAPLHHHFELGGLKETKIVIRFWIIAVILAIISLSTLKIQ